MSVPLAVDVAVLALPINKMLSGQMSDREDGRVDSHLAVVALAVGTLHYAGSPDPDAGVTVAVAVVS